MLNKKKSTHAFVGKSLEGNVRVFSTSGTPRIHECCAHRLPCTSTSPLKAHLRNCTVNCDKNFGAATGNAKNVLYFALSSEPSLRGARRSERFNI